MNKKGKRIFVGLSGGVDSAVTAALLQRARAEVTGVFIRGWYPEGLPCTWAEDRRDAMRVAAQLGIPFVTLNAEKEYKASVLDYLIREYAAGRTPNPDVMCNRDVKFGVFYEFARSHGAGLIATGHYAITKEGRLFRGIDAEKDQSYFLWAVPGAVLTNVVFPLGKMKKSETRVLAKRFRLPVHDKKDSQGICFLGPVSVEDYLRDTLHPEEGKAVDENGREVGRHGGAVLYTLGERIALTHALPGPWFMIAKKFNENEVIVSKTRTTSVSRDTTIRLESTNWFAGTPPHGSLEAQVRYHGSRMTGVLQDAMSFIPDTPLEEPCASGQSLVLYRNDECVGGGIIV